MTTDDLAVGTGLPDPTPARRGTAVVISPVPPVWSYGGSFIRLAAVVDALTRHLAVTVVVVGPPPGAPEADHLSASRRHYDRLGVRILDLRRQPADATRLRRALRLAVRGSGSRLESALRPDRTAELTRLADDADLVWVFKTTPLRDVVVPRHPRLVLDLDDLDERVHPPSTTTERLRAGLGDLTRRRAAARSRAVLVCSELDRRRVETRVRAPVHVVPNPAPGPPDGWSRPPGDTPRPVVVMVGRSQYGPNRDGADWFLREVWPLVHAAVPDARFRMVGPHAEAVHRAHRDRPGVELVGFVSDLGAELSGAAVSVAPLLNGSGTRVKILEAFAWQVPVVATTIAAEGLGAVGGRDLLLADAPDRFADAVVALLGDPVRRRRLTTAALDLVAARNSPAAVDAAVDAVLADVGDHVLLDPHP